MHDTPEKAEAALGTASQLLPQHGGRDAENIGMFLGRSRTQALGYLLKSRAAEASSKQGPGNHTVGYLMGI
jgi:hypothetical protein